MSQHDLPTKTELDIDTAHELGMSPERVAEVTEAFLEAMRSAIVEKGGVRIRGLGKLVAKIEMNNKNVHAGNATEVMRIKLYFSKSGTLKTMLERKHGMTKE